MSIESDIEAALGQVVGLGDDPGPRAEELGQYVLGHVRARPVRPPAPVDPDVLDGLRSLGQADLPSVGVSPLSVHVDFIELLDRFGDPEVWTILGKLKDMLGGTP